MANIFPKGINQAPLKIVASLFLLVTTVVCGISYYFTPKYTRVGYEPTQPVAFDHSLHVEQLGMDCRYCHTYVDRSQHSNIPATSTCMNCHSMVAKDSDALSLVRESYATGEPIPWVRIHKTPDYVYFNHSVHVNRGVSCVSCHGKVNEMEVVAHSESLSMGFCLDCHREPEKYIRPVEEVYNLNWEAGSEEKQLKQGKEFVHDWNINPPQSCTGCHR